MLLLNAWVGKHISVTGEIAFTHADRRFNADKPISPMTSPCVNIRIEKTELPFGDFFKISTWPFNFEKTNQGYLLTNRNEILIIINLVAIVIQNGMKILGVSLSILSYCWVNYSIKIIKSKHDDS